MVQGKRVTAFAIVFAAAACERAELPTTAADVTRPLFAAAGGGHFKSFRVPSDNSRPAHITLGSDGNMWFTESLLDAGKIGRVDARGRITEFAVPNPSSQPDDIVSGPDGALWFTGPSGFPDFFIGRMTTDGQFAGFAPECDPQAGCSIVPQGIAAGPDGNIWFTERLRNAIVKLTPLGSSRSIRFRLLTQILPVSRQVRMGRSGSRSSTGARSAGSMSREPSRNSVP